MDQARWLAKFSFPDLGGGGGGGGGGVVLVDPLRFQTFTLNCLHTCQKEIDKSECEN